MLDTRWDPVPDMLQDRDMLYDLVWDLVRDLVLELE